MLTIQELLFSRGCLKGLDNNAKIKLLRHKDKRIDVYEKYRLDKDWFLKYQSSQVKDIFNGVEYIASFIGEGGSSARFIECIKYLKDGKTPPPKMT